MRKNGSGEQEEQGDRLKEIQGQCRSNGFGDEEKNAREKNR